MAPSSSRWVLDRSLPAASVPVLDDAQRAVVEHPAGPLLVLAGPGTGKTTTLVEAVVERVRRGTPPEQVLVLTFSRRAAEELRDRCARRLAALPGAAVGAPVTATFHAWCLALLRAAEPPGAPPRRLLSGPERLVRVRELVRGGAEGLGRTRWPAALRPAVGTRGFARELADLLDRVRERGLEPADVSALAEAARRPDWAAAATFYAEYVDVLGLAGELDYGELGRQALRLLEDSPETLADVRRRVRAVFVDEYQDTDPAQERLLALLAGGGADLVVVGDPDQSIYAFRGAELDCLLRFPERFCRADGSEAPVRVLRTSRRAGPQLLEVSRRAVVRVPAPGLPVDALRQHRALRPAPGAQDGTAEVRLYATVADEAAAVADLLRREHLERGRDWSTMAVLVRSGRAVPLLRRALAGAGVPVAVAADEVPVARDPAVVPLLLALRVADAQLRAAPDDDAGEAGSSPGPTALPDAESARDLLLSPLGGATPAGLRRLGRALRALERAELAARAGEGVAPELPPPSAELVRRAVEQPGRLVLLPETAAPDAAPVHRLARLLAEARRALDAGGGAEEALWVLWERSGLARRLSAASAAGGAAGRAADRDLDAVVAAFAEVQRLVDRVPRAPVAVLLAALEAQEIPSTGSFDRTEGRLAGGAVRLLTAHRAKGLEWDVVVVAGVQEDTWPDLRRRGSLLDAGLLCQGPLDPPDPLGPPGSTGAAPPVSARLAEERRLFYVALTRARARLVVTAVDSGDEEGERPSRFLEETGLPLPEEPERPGAGLHPVALAGRLRRALLDPTTSDPDRRAAARALARLAPHVPAADPDRWWGVRDWTTGARPVRPQDEPVRLSASAVALHETCPLRWFLAREVRAAAPTTAAQGFGLAVHALARLVADGTLPPDLDTLTARLDEVWPGLDFGAAWRASSERLAAVDALRRFLTWHAQHADVLGAEREFDVEWSGFGPDGEPAAARLLGSMDRVERGPDGRPVVVDLKTSTAKSKEAASRDPQLGVYQIAVRGGALGEPAEPGGAALVHLREGKLGPAERRQPPLEPDDPWADELLGRVVGSVGAERFPARPNDGCDRCPFRGSCPAQDAGGQVVA